MKKTDGDTIAGSPALDPAPVKKFKVLIECRNDITGKSFAPGQFVAETDFPESVIENWLSIRVIEEV